MPVTYNPLTLNRYLDAFTGRANLDNQNTLTTSITVQLYPGSPPALPTTGLGGALLTQSSNTFTFSAPVSGVATLNGPLPYRVTSAGTIGFLRLSNQAGAFADLTASTTGGGGSVIFNNLNATTAQDVNLTAMAIRIPATNGGTLRFNTALQNQYCRMVSTNGTVIAMGVSGTLDVYNGAQPATANDAATGTRLVSFSINSATAFTAAANTATGLAAAITATGLQAGTATWARWTKGTFVVDGSVGTAGADFILASTTITTGTNATTLSDIPLVF